MAVVAQPAVRRPPADMNADMWRCARSIGYKNRAPGSKRKRFPSVSVCAATSPPPCAGAVPRKRLAAFVSGGGSNFKAVQDAITAGNINGDFVVRSQSDESQTSTRMYQ